MNEIKLALLISLSVFVILAVLWVLDWFIVLTREPYPGEAYQCTGVEGEDAWMWN